MLASAWIMLAALQSPEAVEPPPRRAPGMVVSARAPSLPDGPTRVVCSRERAMDTNIQRRVCRRVPVNSSERERMASDMMKDMQRLGRIEGD
ncbi:hypothetical protein ACIQTU_13690 [Brevundimonas sp. NPDC090276]|uniref:hypothetical protein n=1 Tax=Brevundimonas sp. NPDC090276 TaxID=3363956 RepID=UPI00383A7A90